MLKNIFIILVFLFLVILYLEIYSLSSNGITNTLNINAVYDIKSRFSNLFSFNLSAKCNFAYLDMTSKRYINFIVLTPTNNTAKKISSIDFLKFNANKEDFLFFDYHKKSFQNISRAKKLLNDFLLSDLKDVAIFRGKDKYGDYNFIYNKKSNLLIYISNG